MPHSWLTHLLTGYSLQLIAALPRARFVEFNVSQSPLHPRRYGRHAVPAGSGRHRSPSRMRRMQAIMVDLDFVRAHRVN